MPSRQPWCTDRPKAWNCCSPFNPTPVSRATTGLDAVRAHLLELAHDYEAAVTNYRAAAAKTGSLPERNYLLTQAARLS